MLFRNSDGKLVELNRYDFKNDRIYYKKILSLKNLTNNTPKQITSSSITIQKTINVESLTK
jgi:hypothetical protein